MTQSNPGLRGRGRKGKKAFHGVNLEMNRRKGWLFPERTGRGKDT